MKEELLSRSAWKEMEQYLAAGVDPEEDMTVPMACGFIYGVVITPKVSSPLDWIPELFGGELPERKQDDLLEMVTFFSKIFNRMLKQFHGKRLEFPFSYNNLTNEDVDMIHQWVYGLDLALRSDYAVWMQEEDPFIQNEEIDDVSLSLYYIHSLADPDAVKETLVEGDTFDPFDQETIVNLLAAMPSAVEMLTRFGHQLDAERRSALDGPDNTAAVKVGRNAPCPCGSGKKYKKCCGRSNMQWN